MDLDFTQFSQELRQEISAASRRLELPKNEVLVCEGDRMRYLPLLKSGLIRVYNEDVDQDRELLLYYVEPGQTCMMSFVASLRDRISLVSAKIEEDAEIVLIPVENVYRWRSEYEEWNQWILDIFLERYGEVMDTIRELTFQNIEARVTNYLRKISAQEDTRVIETTHLSLAHTLGTTRVVISRILKKMEHEGLLKLQRGRIILNKLKTPRTNLNSTNKE